jgi:hypothetical protein
MIAAFLAPYLMRIILYASITAAIGGGFLYVKIHYEHIGRDKAIAAIAAGEKGALEDVEAAKAKVEECYSGNGTWDAVRGVCS